MKPRDIVAHHNSIKLRNKAVAVKVYPDIKEFIEAFMKTWAETEYDGGSKIRIMVDLSDFSLLSHNKDAYEWVKAKIFEEYSDWSIKEYAGGFIFEAEWVAD
jgi:hypothetical protein